MPQPLLQKINGAWFIFSFSSGWIPATQPKLVTERDFLARALWLERQGREREADALLDHYCEGRRVFETAPP